jgi:hypothetical protein
VAGQKLKKAGLGFKRDAEFFCAICNGIVMYATAVLPWPSRGFPIFLIEYAGTVTLRLRLKMQPAFSVRFLWRKSLNGNVTGALAWSRQARFCWFGVYSRHFL